MNILETFRAIFFPEQTDVGAYERFDEKLSPNMRALRLSVTIADVLVATGVPVSDVVTMVLDVTDRYCKRKVQFDINSTLITASQDRGNDREPLTLVRHAQPRDPNNMLVQSLQELVREISESGLPLDKAEVRLDTILRQPRHYPRWAMTIGSALISVGVGIMFGAPFETLIAMFLIALAVAYFLRGLTHRRVPTFFAQVIAAMFITLVAAYAAWAGTQGYFPLFSDVNPTFVVIGGITMLAAGLAVVGAVQDAIDEFYVTANARLLKVIMMTAGIVAGVLIGLYISQKTGLAADITTSLPIGRNDHYWGSIGAMLLASGYALSVQTRPAGIFVSGAMGVLAWFTYTLTLQHGLTAVAASGVAAMAVGAVATLIARIWKTPSVALISAGILPLVPGLALYKGLLEVTEGASLGTSLDQGILSVLTAALIALAIGAGASFGNIVARPVRRTLVRARNTLPQRRLHQ